MENIFGILAALSSISLNVIGMPSQILKHYREKKVGLTSLFVIMAFSNHVFWLAYGISISSPYIIATQCVGLVLSSVIFWQKFVLYTK